MPAYTRLVFLDGVCVPIVSTQVSWGISGQIQLSIALSPSFEAEKLLASTMVHVFHGQTDQWVARKQVVGVDASDTSLDPRDKNYLKHSFGKQASATLGSPVSPMEVYQQILSSEEGAFDGLGYDDAVKARLLGGQFVYLAGGYIVRVNSITESQQGTRVELQCAGFDMDLSLLQLIQMVKGRGTLTDIEKRFFGQDISDKARKGTVLGGSTRMSFADEIVDILMQDFAGGVRRLIGQYCTLTNHMWQHRFGWTRLAEQILTVEGDTSIKRLIGSKSFRDYLRARLQSSYVVPFQGLIQEILGFCNYRMVCIPAPAYFPFVSSSSSASKSKERETKTIRRSGGAVSVSWKAYTKYDPADVPNDYPDVGKVGSIGFEDGNFVYIRPESREILPTFDLGPGSVQGQLDSTGTRITASLPLRNSQGKLVWGGGAKIVLSTVEGAGVHLVAAKAKFSPGDRFTVSVPLDVIRSWGGFGTQLRPYSEMVFQVSLSAPKAVTIRATDKKELPPENSDRPSSDHCKLGTYAILPHLWFAVPPSCNVVIPEDLYSLRMDQSPITTLTRLLGKLPPGIAKGTLTQLDKFTAPNNDDLNRALEDVDQDWIDAQHLQKTEYLAGVRASVESYDNLTRMARRSAWEPYLRASLHHRFWSERLGARTAQIVMRPRVGVVTGSTLLVIRATGETQSLDIGLTPEQLELLARIRSLNRLRALLLQARSRLQGILRRAMLIKEWIRTCKRLAVTLYDERQAEALPKDVANSLWEERSGKLRYLNVTNSYTELHGERGAREEIAGTEGLEASAGNLGVPEGLANLGEALPYSVVEEEGFPQAFRALLGPQGDRIIPNQGLIEELPPVKDLEDMESKIGSRFGGNRACIAALTRDIAKIDAALKKLRDQLAGLGRPTASSRSIIGYVDSISDNVEASTGRPVWQVTLTHVRAVGEDLDWDGIAGDDVENTVAFGEDGYLDDRYHSAKIHEVYAQVFGCTSLSDLPQVKESFAQDLRQAPDTSDWLDSFLTTLEHPSVCGRSYVTPSDKIEMSSRADTTYACEAVIREYIQLKAEGATTEQLFSWVHKLTARSFMSLSDAYRSVPVVYSKYSETDASEVRYEDLQEEPFYPSQDEAKLPEGFWSKSIYPVLGSGEVVDPRDLRYAEDLREAEKALLQARKEATLAYLGSLRYRTFSRGG